MTAGALGLLAVYLGVLLATVKFRAEVLWFVPVLFLVIRPLSVGAALLGTPVTSSPSSGTMPRSIAPYTGKQLM